MRVTRHHTILIAVLIAGCACSWLALAQSNERVPNDGVRAVELTSSAALTWWKYTRLKSISHIGRPYIPLSCWHETIRELDPLYVYMHRLNIVVVLKRKNDVEEGKYMYVSLSSYRPRTGDDGFEFSPNPENTWGVGLFDFKRNIGKSPQLQPTDPLGRPEGRP